MPAELLLGRELAKLSEARVAKAIRLRQEAGFRPPSLAVIVVGDDPASLLYIERKQAACERVGMLSHRYHLASGCQLDSLLALIQECNQDDSIDGILLQLPLPAHLNAARALAEINPAKDVDGFHPSNLGLLAQGQPFFTPCTPSGILKLLQSTKIKLRGLHGVVIGTSLVVGRPMGLLLLQEGLTVTYCHSATQALQDLVALADILIVATGRAGLIPGSWLKPGVVVIDVGLTRLANGRLQGDVVFETARARASWITPVPGGVGPMTVAALLDNTLLASERISQG